ncbi:MAG: hypothetical protein KIT31_04865 [Deltaproteobacteria bacterium]|nr:hypothetical protein [Deltaproteobacteria bacterium]
MRRALPILIALSAMATTADAQPYAPARPAPPPVRAVWDSSGWEMLGERTVNGRVDRDTIAVGRYEGRYNKLTLVVTDSDLELLEFKITFADRTTYEPRVQQFFRENQRTRVIDLPPGESIIQKVDLKYRNLPGGGNAKVQVWGFKTGPAVVVRRATWDNRGWVKLGEQTVDGRRRPDSDTIVVGRYEGRFSKLTMVVEDSDLELLDFAVTFGPRGETWRPSGIGHYFRENQRTRVIDLPGDERIIQKIDLRYRNLPGGGRAKVEIWGFKEAPRPAFSWDQRGWTMLGEQTVNGRGREDADRIVVGRDFGKFERLTLVVLDSDLELTYFNIAFRGGQDYQPPVTHYFREGTRTRVIDLPGAHRRTIKHIDLRYRNLPGGGKARVQVWGK